MRVHVTDLLNGIRKAVFRERRQFTVYAGLSGVIVGMTILARVLEPLVFRRFIAAADPVAVVTLICVFGAALLSVLLARDGFAIVRREPGPGLLRAAVLASLFGTIIIGVDIAIVHPADMNVPFPQSLLFYPVVGLMVEILFHAFPLVILLTVLPALLRQARFERIVWISLVLVALLEPSFQVAAMAADRPIVGASHSYPAWAVAYDGLHVFAINLCGLWMFRRYDFVSMYALRLVYYAIWHMAWGHLRLGALF